VTPSRFCGGNGHLVKVGWLRWRTNDGDELWLSPTESDSGRPGGQQERRWPFAVLVSDPAARSTSPRICRAPFYSSSLAGHTSYITTTDTATAVGLIRSQPLRALHLRHTYDDCARRPQHRPRPAQLMRAPLALNAAAAVAIVRVPGGCAWLRRTASHLSTLPRHPPTSHSRTRTHIHTTRTTLFNAVHRATRWRSLFQLHRKQLWTTVHFSRRIKQSWYKLSLTLSTDLHHLEFQVTAHVVLI